MIKEIYITKEELDILIQFREVIIPTTKDGSYIRIFISKEIK